jgi:threonine/homoserine/homoserine lactone efflux protein
VLYFLTLGTVLGLSAGFVPGPLLTLVIAETVRHNFRAGLKIALAPLITDLPIILIALFLLSRITGFESVLGIISIIGGGFILYMGYEGLRTSGQELDLRETRPKSLTRGILANALNPHPYLFWISVGAPTVIKAIEESVLSGVIFLGSFYVLLVGSKIGLALLASRSKAFLVGHTYIYAVRGLGLALCLLSILLFRDGLRLLNLL